MIFHWMGFRLLVERTSNLCMCHPWLFQFIISRQNNGVMEKRITNIRILNKKWEPYRPVTPTGCTSSPPRRSAVDSWHCKAKEFPRLSHNHSRPQLKVCVMTPTRSVPNAKISRRACVCLVFEICVLVSTQSVLFWKVTRCYIVFSVLDFLSAQC